MNPIFHEADRQYVALDRPQMADVENRLASRLRQAMAPKVGNPRRAVT